MLPFTFYSQKNIFMSTKKAINLYIGKTYCTYENVVHLYHTQYTHCHIGNNLKTQSLHKI